MHFVLQMYIKLHDFFFFGGGGLFFNAATIVPVAVVIVIVVVVVVVDSKLHSFQSVQFPIKIVWTFGRKS